MKVLTRRTAILRIGRIGSGMKREIECSSPVGIDIKSTSHCRAQKIISSKWRFRWRSVVSLTVFSWICGAKKKEKNCHQQRGVAHLYHGDRVEALVSLVKRIREAVGDDFLIIANTRTEKIPRSAPYVNGAYIETWDDAYPRERLIEIEKALSWYEENLRYPQVNSLKVAMNTSEPWDSPANRRLVRAATTLTLTHSNGYISILGGEFKTDSYWYRFFDAPARSECRRS